MPVVATTDPHEVRRLCDEVVALDPVVHTVFGTIAEWTAREGASVWAAHPADAPTTLAARSRADTPVALTDGWGDVRALAGLLAVLDPPPAALAGPPQTVDALAGLLGLPVIRRMSERLFRLDELVEPTGVEGRARRATLDDFDVLVAWYADFEVEAIGRQQPGQDAAVRAGIESGGCWVWLDGADELCSFAQRRPAVDGVSRIGPVYTPPRLRGHGYGSAATAAATRDVLAEGAVACLYTDLANPTSNKIYQALGYVPVLDRTMVSYD
jgi:GNAT superfamily N-acetyltransferase